MSVVYMCSAFVSYWFSIAFVFTIDAVGSCSIRSVGCLNQLDTEVLQSLAGCMW
ncbi:hypothetical protein M6B38_233080 [Iris pallida]|uniref:Uncharacterized protein n=1 Tax=Iris pallida TaxID=29817 RepID=A0AAX6DQ83_IRIPA|nr:hypothetical protein M6B38_233080 [Iris pallida]